MSLPSYITASSTLLCETSNLLICSPGAFQNINIDFDNCQGTTFQFLLVGRGGQGQTVTNAAGKETIGQAGYDYITAAGSGGGCGVVSIN